MAANLTAAPTDEPLVPVSIEPDVLALGRRLGQRRRSLTGVRSAAHERAMALVARDHALRAALFRLVDVAPACGDETELAAHLAAYLDGQAAWLPALGARSADSALLRRPAGRVAAAMVRQMAHRFIAGETIEEAAPTLRALWSRGIATTVDLLGEATVTPAEGLAYTERCEAALFDLAAAAQSWPRRPLIEADSATPLPRVNLSVKVTAMTPLVRAAAPDRGRAGAAPHLRRLLRCAAELGAHLHVDMESMNSRELVLDLVLDLLDEEEFAAAPSVGLVLQAYLRDSEDLLDRVLERTAAAGRSLPLTVRLVKGAYWDHEVIDAEQNGWAPPVWTEKAESDRCFERLSCRLVDSFPLVRPAFASHNLRSLAFAAAYARHAGLAREDIELQVLRGLGDQLAGAITAAGLRCRAYSPVGDLVSGMAYLVRRLLENTSNDSFLSAQAAGSDLDELLRRP